MTNHNSKKYNGIIDYINKNGIGKFNTSDTKKLDRALFNDISKRLGGFKKIKSMILDGAIFIEGYSLNKGVSEDLNNQSIENLIVNKESSIEVSIANKTENNLTQETENGKNCVDVEVVDDNELFSKDILLSSIKKVLSNQENVIQLITSFKKELNDLKQNFNKFKFNSDMMNDKLKLIEDDMVDVKAKCVQSIKRYAAIKYCKLNKTTIQLAYNDIYEKFNEFYNVNLYSVQCALIRAYNYKKIKKKERVITYIEPNIKGLRVIDVVERLGMITELYLLITKEIGECALDDINRSDFIDTV